jgi:hypothetical protein
MNISVVWFSAFVCPSEQNSLLFFVKVQIDKVRGDSSAGHYIVAYMYGPYPFWKKEEGE